MSALLAASLKSLVLHQYPSAPVERLDAAWIAIESGDLAEVKTVLDFARSVDDATRIDVTEVIVDTLGTAIDLGWSENQRAELANAIGKGLGSAALTDILRESEEAYVK